MDTLIKVGDVVVLRSNGPGDPEMTVMGVTTQCSCVYFNHNGDVSILTVPSECLVKIK